MVIDSWENGQYKEIWVYSKETENDERAMCGLINGDWGWLNYYHEECDAGLSSRNRNSLDDLGGIVKELACDGS